MGHSSLFTSFAQYHTKPMPSERSTLLPPPVPYNGVLDGTIQNLDQAHGYTAHTRVPVNEVRRPDHLGDWKGINTPSLLRGKASTVISNSAARSRSPLDDMPPAHIPDIVPETPMPGLEPLAMNVVDRLEQITVDRRRLVDDLNASTALVKNLRLRCDIHEADLVRYKAALKSQEVESDAKVKQVMKDRTTWILTSCASLGISAAYVGWCWVNRVEFEYIQRRRREMFGL